MAVRFPFAPHALICTLIVGVSLAGFGATALAKEPGVAASAPAASSPARELITEPQAKAVVDVSKRLIKLPSAQNPLDRVRERLAEKLGAPRPVGAQDPNTLRFVARAAAAVDPAALVAPSASAPRARPVRVHAPVAASLAATHRAEAATEPAEPAHWDYGGANAAVGPEHWGELRPEFSKCSGGNRQSPIDIRDGIKVDLDPVQFDYKPSAFRVIDNGHTVQVNVGPGSSIEVGGRRYDLVQFHFHRPSEERVNGKQFDMVVHLVHKDIDGRLAVVAVLLDRGAAHPLVQSVWNNLPLEKGDEVAARATLDLNTLLPTERGYYTYMGSLTTPPCSEGVLWMVMKASLPISADQINIFARLYPMNARPIQAAGGRLIKESN